MQIFNFIICTCDFIYVCSDLFVSGVYFSKLQKCNHFLKIYLLSFSRNHQNNVASVLTKYVSSSRTIKKCNGLSSTWSTVEDVNSTAYSVNQCVWIGIKDYWGKKRALLCTVKRKKKALECFCAFVFWGAVEKWLLTSFLGLWESVCGAWPWPWRWSGRR